MVHILLSRAEILTSIKAILPVSEKITKESKFGFKGYIMHSWFTQKLNEMIGLAHYCEYPILKAHIALTQQAVDDIYSQHKPDGSTLTKILPLMISQAEIDGEHETAHHMRRALHALGSDKVEAENVVEVDFNASAPQRSRSGI